MNVDNKKRVLRQLENINTMIGFAIDDVKNDRLESAFEYIEEMRGDLDWAARVVEDAC